MQYKQMLCCAGVERYYQVARCFRDEDLRSDRCALRTCSITMQSFSKSLSGLPFPERPSLPALSVTQAFQIALCLHLWCRRDSCVATDRSLCRQPEFSQLDMEMTFMDENAIISLVEELVATVFSKVEHLPADHYPHDAAPGCALLKGALISQAYSWIAPLDVLSFGPSAWSCATLRCLVLKSK